MSLLMDALRRAQQDKQAHEDAGEDVVPAAGQDPGATGGEHGVATRTGEDVYAGPEDVTQQVEPAAVRRAEAAHEAARSSASGTAEEYPGSAPATDAAAGPATDSEDHSASFELDEIAAAEMALEEERDLSRTFARVADAAEGADSDDVLALEPLDDEDGAAAGTGVAAEETYTDGFGATTVDARGSARPEQTATIPSSRSVENDLDAYFDRSRSAEMPRRPRPGDETLEDVAAHTVVGAQTVFAAAERPRSRRVFVAAAIVAVVLVLAIGLAGLFIAQQSTGPRPIPPPTVAAGVERPVVRELPVVPLDPSPPSPPPGATALVRLDTLAGTDG
ncbi:MAG: hypothetical protein ACU85V_16645, partial [Gammaproteobacteria bacterium]